MLVRLDGRGRTIDESIAVAAGRADSLVDPAALRPIDERRAMLHAARERGAVHGANTGVGANRPEVSDDDGHGLRLLRSHRAAAGPLEDAATARSATTTRLNHASVWGSGRPAASAGHGDAHRAGVWSSGRPAIPTRHNDAHILAGGSGISRRVAEALAEAVRVGAVPTLHSWGAIGTADLAARAELGLTLAGECPWQGGAGPVTTIDATDALPIISSSALTVATAALALDRVRGQLRASAVVAALSFLALRGNPGAYDAAVHRARAHPGQVEVAAVFTSSEPLRPGS